MKKKKFNKKARRNELDKLWSLRVRERDLFICQQCTYEVGLRKGYGGSPKPDKKNHAHHIVSKAVGGYGARWDIDNGICLCYKHHIIKLEDDPITYSKFLNEWLRARGMDWFDMKATYAEIFVKFNEDFYNLKKNSLT